MIIIFIISVIGGLVLLCLCALFFLWGLRLGNAAVLKEDKTPKFAPSDFKKKKHKVVIFKPDPERQERLKKAKKNVIPEFVMRRPR